MAHFHLLTGTEAVTAPPVVRRISFTDLRDALAKGIDDFKAMPSHALFLCVIYPVIGMLLGAVMFGYGLIPLAYPLVAGFALLGPLAAIAPSWRVTNALTVRHLASRLGKRRPAS